MARSVVLGFSNIVLVWMLDVTLDQWGPSFYVNNVSNICVTRFQSHCVTELSGKPKKKLKRAWKVLFP